MLPHRLAATLGLLLGCLPLAARADVPPPDSAAAKLQAEKLSQLPPEHPGGSTHIDHSGRKQEGRASFYAKSFADHKMADGRRMNPNANIAASRTLPLGTTAAVTNLRNGKTATVKIEDRGPYIKGRVVDLSPKVAGDLGIKKQGVAPVVVKPIAVPLPDGKVKLGAGAATASPRQIRQATATTKALVGDTEAETADRR